MYSAYKLNKQGDNIQPWYTPFPIWTSPFSMSNSKRCFLTWIQISQEAGKVVWYFHLLKNLPQFVVIHTVKGFAAAAAKLLQSCPAVCNPIDGSPPGSPIPGVLQARTWVGCLFLLQCMKMKSESGVTQSHPTLCDPRDCSLPGSSIHRIFQARVLEWVAISFSSNAGDMGSVSWLGRFPGEGCFSGAILLFLWANRCWQFDSTDVLHFIIWNKRIGSDMWKYCFEF